MRREAIRRAATTTSIAVASVAMLGMTGAWTSKLAQAEYYEPIGYVTATSDFGNGTVRGPVRRTSRGLQVRMPGGTWINCEKSCKETLRLATVDFFHSEEGAGPDGFTSQGPGIFGKLKWEWGW